MKSTIGGIALLIGLSVAVGAATLMRPAPAATPGWTYAPIASPGPVAVATGTPAASAGHHDVLGTFEIEAFDLGFTPATISVEKAGSYTVNVSNTGTIPLSSEMGAGSASN